MAVIVHPTLFSVYFGIPASALEDAGLIDPFVDVDTQLFIDPILLDKSNNRLIKADGMASFRKHFGNLIRLLKLSKDENDAAWKGARRLLDLSEPPENGLGFGGSGRSGSSRPDEIREAILRTAKQIVDLGSADPEMISLMGFFEKDVGPDTISDFTTQVIINQLAQITEKFCLRHGIPVHQNDVVPDHKLPKFTDKNLKDSYLVLVPQDVVRHLPIANDASEIDRAVSANIHIRDRVNAFLAGLIKPTVADRKDALRSAALASSEMFELFLRAIKESASSYDPNLDALGYYKLKQILREGWPDLISAHHFALKKGPTEVRRVALECIEHFKHHVENGNLWEELWIGDKPKVERAAQLIFYAIAECFCIANDIDISPEANMGGGPVDFKFSDGFKARVLVELKRDTGTVRHGYETQLEIYKDTSRTQIGIFVVLDYGNLGNKLEQIQQIRNDRLAKGLSASEIIVIDATKKESASKRGRSPKKASSRRKPKAKK